MQRLVWHGVGFAAAVLTLWGVGSVIDAATDLQHRFIQGLLGLTMLVVAILLWLRWWRA